MQTNNGNPRIVEEATILFAGDSGDGMQLTGTQFTNTAAMMGNDVATLPNYPAEIRSPAGTLYGVSSFQVHFGSVDVHTPGDECDMLVAMNPAALKVSLHQLKYGGIILVNEDQFTEKNLRLAEYDENPLDNDTLDRYQVYRVEISKLTALALEDSGLSPKEIERCKNFFALGITYFLYNRDVAPTIRWIGQKFKSRPELANANKTALQAGYNFAYTAEFFTSRYTVEKAQLAPGKYRNISGTQALAYGLVAAAERAQTPLFYGGYPITPASDLLHYLSTLKHFGVKTFQAEDEIAAIGSAIGASYAGNIAVTGTSGAGVSLKTEAIGLAVMAELPLVIVNIQRGGPSTGLPTKTEQSDLYQAMFGRHGEAPLIVLAAKTPANCFEMAFEAVRLAQQHMTPVILLSDGYLGNGSEPWRLPDVDRLPPINITFAENPETYQPYQRDENLVRLRAIPGMPGFEHRIGGLEKENISGNVSYDPANHELMTKLRQEKVDRVAENIPDLGVEGDPDAELLILGWGSTYGSIKKAVENLLAGGIRVAHAHLMYLNPFPKNTEAVLRSYKTILVPEINNGQLVNIIRAKYLLPAIPFNIIQGRPFKAVEIEEKVKELLNSKNEYSPNGSTTQR